MGVLRLQHLVSAHRFKAVGEQQALVDVLVIDGQQTMGGAALQRKKHQAIVVHAHLHGLLLRRVAGVGFVDGHVARDAHRIAPRGQDCGHVVGGQLDEVAQANGHGFEADAAGFGMRRQRRQAAQQAQPSRQLQGLAFGRIADLVNVQVAGAIAVLHLREVFGHGSE